MAKLPTILLSSVLWLTASLMTVEPACAQIRVSPAQRETIISNGLPVGVPEAVGGIYGDQLLRYDSQHPWMHGYFQEIPAYGGFGAFRPYNYKHILSQSQAAGGWGMSPTMPYSQQFWHRYRKRAGMRPQLTDNHPAGSRAASTIQVRRRGPDTASAPPRLP